MGGGNGDALVGDDGRCGCCVVMGRWGIWEVGVGAGGELGSAAAVGGGGCGWVCGAGSEVLSSGMEWGGRRGFWGREMVGTVGGGRGMEVVSGGIRGIWVGCGGDREWAISWRVDDGAGIVVREPEDWLGVMDWGLVVNGLGVAIRHLGRLSRGALERINWEVAGREGLGAETGLGGECLGAFRWLGVESGAGEGVWGGLCWYVGYRGLTLGCGGGGGERVGCGGWGLMRRLRRGGMRIVDWAWGGGRSGAHVGFLGGGWVGGGWGRGEFGGSGGVRRDEGG
ncbi:hypothetical protein Tco_1196075 [Tanacetum coccineum]